MAADPGAALATRARAKVNLTLDVLGRRADGYHELHSLVAFAATGDLLTLVPAQLLSLTIDGPEAAGLAPGRDNLVLRAALALAAETGPLRWGAFHLVKRLPVASGIGGGSADAAAALRLLARANAIASDDPALLRVAAAIGADVSVCLASRARLMAGIGERLGPPLRLPPLFALLVNPHVPVETAAVFRALGLQPGQSVAGSGSMEAGPAGLGHAAAASAEAPTSAELLRRLADSGNALEAPAMRVAPVIASVLSQLRALPECRLARMSGSGATCFALFDDCRASAAAGRALKSLRPDWWIKATLLR